MQHTEFEHDLAVVIGIDPATLLPNYKLIESDCWDSLAIVSTLAMISRYFKKAASGDRLEKCETLQDIYDYVANLPESV